MNYYEFNNHEYYALIKEESIESALDYYLKNVSGESIEDILEGGEPDTLKKLEALCIFANSFSQDKNKPTFNEVFNIFTDKEVKLLLIDGSLL